jgi:hypothetical protein
MCDAQWHCLFEVLQLVHNMSPVVKGKTCAHVKGPLADYAMLD